jgi:hypothetical protein
LSSCGLTPKEYKTSGGSKADAIIEMSFSYGWLEDPEVDIEHAQYEAAQRCKSWGFDEADAFDLPTETCIRMSKKGNCKEFRVTKKFQCIG